MSSDNVSLNMIWSRFDEWYKSFSIKATTSFIQNVKVISTKKMTFTLDFFTYTILSRVCGWLWINGISLWCLLIGSCARLFYYQRWQIPQWMTFIIFGWRMISTLIFILCRKCTHISRRSGANAGTFRNFSSINVTHSINIESSRKEKTV